MNKVLINIRKHNILYFLMMLLMSAFLSFVLFGGVQMVTQEELNIWYIVFLVFVGFITFFSLRSMVYYAKIVIKPEEAPIFKKYGSPDNVLKILNEIENTIEYEDKNLVISKKYISDKKDYSKIVACNDVLGAHKLVHKTNFVIDYYQIVIIDKYNEEMTYKYGRDDEEKVNQLLILIGSKCKNAELGYTQKEREHIEKNKVDLVDNSNKKTNIKTHVTEDKQNDEEYKCPDCNNNIEFKDKFCKECGCKIDWSDFEE